MSTKAERRRKKQVTRERRQLIKRVGRKLLTRVESLFVEEYRAAMAQQDNELLYGVGAGRPLGLFQVSTAPFTKEPDAP